VASPCLHPAYAVPVDVDAEPVALF